jgi:FSR family fosmidomycin resistance protein-like MFS transporter
MAATLVLIPLGLVLTANFSVMIVMAQEFLPNHLGVASGVTLGIGASVGGIAMPLFGRLADWYGMHTSLSWLMVVAATTAVLAILTDRLARLSMPAPAMAS